MKLALESPFFMLRAIEALTDIDFLQTHLLENDDYCTFFQSRKKGRIRILDNATNELGKPVKITSLFRAAEVVKADYVCPPDYLGDAFRTLEGLKEAQELILENKLPFRLLPIVQGRSLSETFDMLEIFNKKLGYTRVAIPLKVLSSKDDPLEDMSANRIAIIKSRPAQSFEWIHLLGLGTLEELSVYQNYPTVSSLDTGAPITNGINGKIFGQHSLTSKTEMLDFTWGVEGENKRDNISLVRIYYNIAYLRKLISF